MADESDKNDGFKIENCRAKYSIDDLVACLVTEQALVCGFSAPFGKGYFCQHPRRKEIVEITKKLRNKQISSSKDSQSDNQKVAR